MFFKVLKCFYPFIFLEDGDGDPSPDNNDGNPPIPNPDEVIDIKKNYVHKKDYEKLEQDYKKIVDTVLNGGELPADNPNGEEAPDVSELRKELYDPNNSLSNLDYIKKTLQLREEIIKEGGNDPFLPTGINGDPFKTDQEREAAEQSANKVAKVLKEAVDEAGDDPETFDIILSKIIK